MKIITTLILILSSIFVFSQDFGASGDRNSGLSSVNEALRSTSGAGSIFFNKPNDIVGKIHLFENWANVGKIDIDGKIFKMFNINFNIKTNNFESKVGKDSIYVFDISNIEQIHINNRKFKNYFFQGKNKNFEIVYNGGNMKLMKGYEIDVKYGKPDPTMVRKTEDKYFTTTKYYIKEGTDIKEISLKKKNILVLFKDKSTAVSSYVKKNKLSYKKDRDLNRILKYHNSL